MLRRVLPILVLTVAACSRSDRDALPAATVLVNDSLGLLISFAPSPDRSRLAWSQPVKGAAAIWVGNADGSDRVRLTHGVWDITPVWSPDGKWIAYHGESPDFDVLVVSSEGGASRPLTSGRGIETPVAWRADGTGVLYTQQGRGDVQTYIAPLDGGPARPIVAAQGGDQYVAISPDGSKALFDLHRGAENTVWVQDLPSGTPRRLGSEGFESLLPTNNAWAPDSRHVVYESRRTGTWDLWIADVESGEVRQLTHDVRNDVGATWSPDGRWIAFSSDRGGERDIWVIPSAGGSARRVTNDLEVEAQQELFWSRDGQTLFYITYALEGGLGVTAPDGGAPRMLVDWPGYSISIDPVLSPDGSTVIFASNRSGNFDLWSVPVAGGEPTPFAASPLEEASPRFSSDGSQVLFESNRSGSTDLWVKPASGGDARRLTDWPSNETEGRWSPDGSRIAFLSNRSGAGVDIWLVPASGGDPTRVTRFQAPISSVAWAKDGKSLFAIVTESNSGVRRLYRVPVAGAAPVALQMSPNGGAGILSPDGSQYAYASFDGGFAFVEVTPTAGGAPRRITRATGNVFDVPYAWSPDGTRLGVQSWLFGEDATPNVAEVSASDGAKRELTNFQHSFETPFAYSADGKQVLFAKRGTRSRIMSVRIGDLLAREAAPSP